jgi:TetR/AcrR family transcriptional repressor of nem operon
MPSKRDEIIDSALELVRSHGYHRASLDAILSASGAGKGQFYHYFRSKEDFGIALLERAWARECASIRGHLESVRVSSSDPLDDIFRALDLIVSANRDNPCAAGCIFGTLAQEMAAEHERFRTQLASVFRQQADLFADRFADAKARGVLPHDVNEQELARFLLSVLEGSLLLMKTERSVAYLEEGVSRFKEYVLLLATHRP